MIFDFFLSMLQASFVTFNEPTALGQPSVCVCVCVCVCVYSVCVYSVCVYSVCVCTVCVCTECAYGFVCVCIFVCVLEHYLYLSTKRGGGSYPR